MNIDALKSFLLGTQEPMETLAWLNSEFAPLLRNALDSVDVRRRLGIYEGEIIPANERNLTDTRNRISLILEYELARIATRVLEDHGIHDVFWSHVVANRFPASGGETQ